MDINKEITITLREDEVRKIVADYLTREGYPVEYTDVTIHVGRTTKGYGMAEYEVAVFEKCTAVLKGK